jgi:hypothetical protein
MFNKNDCPNFCSSLTKNRVPFLIWMCSFLQNLYSKNLGNWLHGPDFSWELDSCAESEEIPLVLRHINIHHRLHNIVPFLPVLSEINSVHIRPAHLFEIYFNIFRPSMLRSCKLSLSLDVFLRTLCLHFKKTARCEMLILDVLKHLYIQKIRVHAYMRWNKCCSLRLMGVVEASNKPFWNWIPN